MTYLVQVFTFPPILLPLSIKIHPSVHINMYLDSQLSLSHIFLEYPNQQIDPKGSIPSAVENHFSIHRPLLLGKIRDVLEERRGFVPRNKDDYSESFVDLPTPNEAPLSPRKSSAPENVEQHRWKGATTHSKLKKKSSSKSNLVGGLSNSGDGIPIKASDNINNNNNNNSSTKTGSPSERKHNLIGTLRKLSNKQPDGTDA